MTVRQLAKDKEYGDRQQQRYRTNYLFHFLMIKSSYLLIPNEPEVRCPWDSYSIFAGEFLSAEDFR